MTKPGSDDAKIDLNPPALVPAADAPWSHDALQRQDIAAELDALVAQLVGGAESASIALDGGYGTGKTFILQRWVQEMQGRGQVAMYYNAWENDCDDDPLVSLIETLTANDKTGWGKRSIPVLNVALTGILRKVTGIDRQKVLEAGKDQTAGLLQAARGRRESRQKLKGILTELVEATQANEPSGVVVVIDELDRCRPTFANELMERVKHVMSVSGLVFVFGVNILALQETVKAVYGNINAHQYLLRMFTTTLHMPPSVVFRGLDSSKLAREYLEGLVNRHGLRNFATRFPLLEDHLEQALYLLALAVRGGGFTPRELERVLWLLAKVASSSFYSGGEPSVMLPHVLLPLSIARVKDPYAYNQTISRPDMPTAVIDCFFKFVHGEDVEDSDREELDRVEMMMYRICHQHPRSDRDSVPPAHLALRAFTSKETEAVLDDRPLARRSRGINKERAKELLLADPSEAYSSDGAVGHPNLTFEALQLITSRFDVVWAGVRWP